MKKKHLTASQVTLRSFLAVCAVALVLTHFWSPHRGQCVENLTSIAEAMEAYRADHGDYPQSQNELIGRYLPSLPLCPTRDQMVYRSNFGRGTDYAPDTAQTYFIVRCTSQRHRGTRPGFLAIDSVHGLMFASP